MDLRAKGTEYVSLDQESQETIEYRSAMNSEGSPSETISTNYQWTPGTELNKVTNEVI